MAMNRIEYASKGYSSMVSETSVGWVMVAFMFVGAFFLIGYLIQERNKKKKRRRKKLQFKNQNQK
ncbi:MAG: hypothetical protein HQL52_11660 [Magnetococcales bacterium]|nr:hypothetical protein [Magnetococcales bacterium]